MNKKYESFKNSIDNSLESTNMHDLEVKENTAFVVAVVGEQKDNFRRYASKYQFHHQNDAVFDLIKNKMTECGINTYDESMVKKAIAKIGILTTGHFFIMTNILYFMVWALCLIFSDFTVWDDDRKCTLAIIITFTIFPYNLVVLLLSTIRIRFYRV